MNPKYFSLYELCASHTAVSNNLQNIPSWDIVQNLLRLAYRLDDVREKYGKHILVTSGYRCGRVNDLVGGAPFSLHQVGQAADITAYDLEALFAIVQTFPWKECYINKEKNYIHVAL